MIATESTSSLPMRAGVTVRSHAIVLGCVVLAENNKIVHLYTSDFGRISALALRAVNSKKRFGAALEPFTHAMAFLKVPRDNNRTEAPLWYLDRVDMKSSFMHLRESFEWLETALFVTSLVKDNTPEALSDVPLFQNLGRFFRDSQIAIHNKALASWARIFFWVYFSRHLGFGNMASFFSPNFFRGSTLLESFFQESPEGAQPNFSNFFGALKDIEIEKPTLQEEIGIYNKWVEMSGLHWKHFEQWYSVKNL